jgi:hypothetical protein
MPGIINDRLHYMFCNAKGTGNSPDCSPKQKLLNLKKEDFITESSFVKNFTQLFIGELDAKMRFTFEMYDFDNDGFITPEDVRIMMSYMSFNRNVSAANVQQALDQRGIELISSGGSSPSDAMRRQRTKPKEGMYQEDEGKNVDYKDRIND